MIPAILGFFKSLLWDEAAAQRYLAGGCFLVGEWMTSGGVLPGTSTVLPLPTEHLAPIGGLLKAAAIYLGAGGVLPTKNLAEQVLESGKTATPKP